MRNFVFALLRLKRLYFQTYVNDVKKRGGKWLAVHKNQLQNAQLASFDLSSIPGRFVQLGQKECLEKVECIGF